MPPAAPILLEPILKHRAWGGDALLRMGRRAAEGQRPPFGESWELADLPESVPEGRSRIVNGPFRGLTLREAIARDRTAVLGSARATEDDGFPLLVKYLDARENISVQVHPDREQAQRLPNARAKHEAWFVVRAETGACVHRGIDPAVGRAEFEKLLDAERVQPALRRVPVRPGDCVRLPSGICHALGAGVVVAEVQTPSDTTFRLWDWGRRDPARPLHRREALECVRFGAEQHLDSIPVTNERNGPSVDAAGFRTTTLCTTEDFEIESIRTIDEDERSVAGGAPAPIEAAPRSLEVITDGSPVIWMVLEGSVRFEDPGNREAPPTRAARWTTVLLPAAAHGLTARIEPGTRWLRVTIPDRMRRMLAGGESRA